MDPDPVTVESARVAGFDVHQGGVDALADEPASFDVITMNHVVEHAHCPRTLLRHAYHLLKPGGTLYLETPNIDAFGHVRFREHWRGLEPPRHLVIFNWSSLDALLEQEGFSERKRITQYSVYKDLAHKSRALKAGGDPYASSVAIRDRIIGHIAGFRAWFDYRSSEFITIQALKPL